VNLPDGEVPQNDKASGDGEAAADTKISGAAVSDQAEKKSGGVVLAKKLSVAIDQKVPFIARIPLIAGVPPSRAFNLPVVAAEFSKIYTWIK
jgi:hypothetical protein